jgi:hypothetical protein
MANVHFKEVRCWVDELRGKREEVRRRGKENLRLEAILNNAIENNTNLWRELREIRMQEAIRKSRILYMELRGEKSNVGG